MPAGFEAAFPPDDTGRVTFERFRYQAHVAFRFCLEAAAGGDVQAVVCEHFEDVAVELIGGWRLVQIKTRDPELGPWRLSDLLARRGALRALHRTHQALAELDDTDTCRLEARLEGAIARDDDARRLTPLGGGATSAIAVRCAERLEIDEDEALEFLGRVTVVDREPARELIQAVNLDLLSKAAPALTGQELRDTYKRVFERIETAMEGRLLADEFPAALVQPATAGEAAAALVRAKRLDLDTLVALFGAVHAPPVLLRRICDPAALATSALEGKLRLAGANDPIVADAKNLRAQAAYRKAELLASNLFDPAPAIDDVRARLKLLGNSVVATVNAEPPGPGVWAAMMSRLGGEAQAVDPARLFGADQMLLLGELCEVSDLCQFGWGAGA